MKHVNEHIKITLQKVFTPKTTSVLTLTRLQIPGLVLLVHATANIVTTAIDPAEPAVKRKLRSGRRLRPMFNRSVHKHVIEDRYCNLCQVDV